jgi:hypothetical protein
MPDSVNEDLLSVFGVAGNDEAFIAGWSSFGWAESMLEIAPICRALT